MLTVKPISIIQEISLLDTSDSEDMENKNQTVKSTHKLKVVAKPTVLATPINIPINSSIPLTTTQSTTLISSPAKYTDFIKTHYTNKELSSQKPITNTRIGDAKLQIPGGSLSISKEEYPLFLKLYYDAIVADGKMEYLTEKQLETNCPILIDIDLRFPIDITKRQYTKDHIEDLLDNYLDEIKKIFQFDENTQFQIFIFEKDAVNPVPEKQITKDGIHIIIGIQMAHSTQIILRKRILPKIEEIWGDFPIINTWDEVLDDGITEGHTNWQLYGSRKPGYAAYKLTEIYDITYDPSDGEFMRKTVKPAQFDLKNNIDKLSARYENHPSFFYKNDFLLLLNQNLEAQQKKRSSTNFNAGSVSSGSSTFSNYENAVYLQIRNVDELDNAILKFVEDIQSIEYELKESYEYCMTLPVSYYGLGSYTKWIRVGWALRNISNKLFIVWVKFSSQTPSFDYGSIPDLFEKWNTFAMNDPRGLTKRSIMHWSKMDALDAYSNVRKTSMDFYINQTLNNTSNDKLDKTAKGCGDFDIAVVLFNLFKDEFVCPSVKGNLWYQYKNHRWMENDSGTTLRKFISTELRQLYKDKSDIVSRQIVETLGQDSTDDKKGEKLNALNGRIIEIINRLARTNDKKNIMTEAKELFYDGSFIQKLDTNPYLLCFNNGVIDFKENIFRRGYPEDYLSKTTNIDYNELNPQKNQPIIDEINTFMHQLFPPIELYNYMWAHLASTLIGTSANQTFNMYIGVGQNGKSVLVSLMEMVLGEYKGDVPLSLVTDRRTKIGGLAPELLALKGCRYAVMQEPSKGDRINEGIMKQITSGIDPIQARAPYMPQSITFIPQFKLVVCSNEFMEIKSQDHGTWRRIRVVDFLSMFVDNPAVDDPEKPYQYKLDKHIKEKFGKWKEVFMAMLVDIAYKTNGVVEDCAMVMASSNSYRERQDYIAEFIHDKIVADPNGSLTKQELNAEFTIWYQGTYGRGGPSPKDVHAYMDKRYGNFDKYKAWKGAKINYDTNSAIIEDDDDAHNEGEINNIDLGNL